MLQEYQNHVKRLVKEQPDLCAFDIACAIVEDMVADGDIEGDSEMELAHHEAETYAKRQGARG